MGSFYNELKKGFGVTAVSSLFVGILLLIYPQATSQLVCYLLGGLILIQGANCIISAMKSMKAATGGKFLLVWGGILAILGGFFILRTDVIISIIPVLFGMFIFINGMSDAFKAIQLRKNGYEKWLSILGMAILKVVLGGVILLNPFTTAITMIRFIGACLIYGGISTLWTIYCVSKTVIEVQIDE